MYKYELHQHTRICSHCGDADPLLLPEGLKKDGFDGCVITDHFYHGNTGIDRALPWEQFCKPYEEHYLLAKQAGAKIGIDVLFGIEEHVGKGKEVLLYGITPGFMYSHPDLRDCTLETITGYVHEAGGLVIQAHPFRTRDYIPDPSETLPPELLDGFEVYNACNNSEDNLTAVNYAKSFGKITVAGSDSHVVSFPGRFGIACEEKITTEKQLAEILKSGRFEIYTADE